MDETWKLFVVDQLCFYMFHKISYSHLCSVPTSYETILYDAFVNHKLHQTQFRTANMFLGTYVVVKQMQSNSVQKRNGNIDTLLPRFEIFATLLTIEKL